MPAAPVASSPKTLMEFERMFRREEDCRAFLEQLRWTDGFRCACGGTTAWRMGNGLLRCGTCRRGVSVTAGTIFHGSRLPLMVWFRAIWSATSQRAGVSALGLQHALGLGSYRTAWAMLHAIRGVMTLRRRPLVGRICVGVRCFCAGGAKCADPGGRSSWVAIAVEEQLDGTGRVRMRCLPHKSPEELRVFLADVLAPECEVFAEDPETGALLASSGYPGRTEVLTNRGGSRVQLTASHADRWLDGTHQGRYEHKYLQAYLEEFSFRFNRRNVQHPGSLFLFLLESAVACETPDAKGH